MIRMINVAFIRGKYLNNFEGQNYIFESKGINLTAISSLKPLHKQFPFSVIKLPSIADLQTISLFDRPIKYLSNRLIGDAQILFGLERYADQFDIFHTADPYYYYSYQLARLRNQKKIKKLIVTSWETIPFNNETVDKKKSIKRFTQQWSDLFICYTERAKKCLIKEGVDEDKIKVVRLGVNLHKFKGVNVKRLKSYKKKVVILFVGRMVEEKGIKDLYEAYKKLKTQNSKLKTKSQDLKLKIVGEGKLKNKLESMIDNDHLEHFCTIVQKCYEDIPQVYQQADIFVMPSKTTKTWEEQYGMVLIEAMASGLPIVAYKSGAIPEIIDNCGILVKEGNVNQLTNSMKYLIENKNLRIKLGRMGRRRVEKYFDCRETARQLTKIYENISHRSD